jgi:hypothetical protein
VLGDVGLGLIECRALTEVHFGAAIVVHNMLNGEKWGVDNMKRLEGAGSAVQSSTSANEMQIPLGARTLSKFV